MTVKTALSGGGALSVDALVIRLLITSLYAWPAVSRADGEGDDRRETRAGLLSAVVSCARHQTLTRMTRLASSSQAAPLDQQQYNSS